MRLFIVLFLAFVFSQTVVANAEGCRYMFKSGEGLVDTCTGEHASNSNLRGDGPPIYQCHPFYSGCLKPDAEDYDCEGGVGNGPLYIKGPVRIIGDDVFGLDSPDPAKKNGIGCEPDEVALGS